MAERTPQQSAAVAQLRRWALSGEGAKLLRLDAEGGFDRCVAFYNGKLRDPQGWCADLVHEATGKWPGQARGDKR